MKSVNFDIKAHVLSLSNWTVVIRAVPSIRKSRVLLFELDYSRSKNMPTSIPICARAFILDVNHNLAE